MTILTAHHTTTYRYKRAVAFGEHLMMLRPRAWPDQRLLEHSVTIHPEPAKTATAPDRFGNWITVATFDRAADELTIQSHLRVEKPPSPGASSELAGRRTGGGKDPELPVWLQRPSVPGTDTVLEWALEITGADARASAFDRLNRLNTAVREQFRYVRRLERGTRSAAETLRLRSGSCRDLATLMADGARALGYPARFASGYILVPGGEHAIVGGGSTHAWVQAWVPDLGWIDFDPTNGSTGTRDLIRVAVAPRAEQALPLCGTWTGKAGDCIDMTVTVTVTSDAALNGTRPAPSRASAAAAQ